MPGKCRGLSGTVLENQDQENDDCHDKIRRQHVQRVRFPVHRLTADPPTDQRIDEIVDRVEEAIERVAPPVTTHRQIASDRDADQKADQQRQSDLQPTLQVMASLSGDQKRSGWITA